MIIKISNIIFLLCFFVLSPIVAFGAMQEATAVLNTTVPFFNLSTMAAHATSGHVQFMPNAGGNALQPVSGLTTIRYIGSVNLIDFNNLAYLPNSTYLSFDGRNYQSGSSPPLYVFAPMGDAVAVLFTNASGLQFYAGFRANAVANNVNITVRVRFNNQAGNNTFNASSACANNRNLQNCLNDQTNGCFWHDLRGLCEGLPQDNFNRPINNMPPSECGILPQFACSQINNSFCTWVSTEGKGGMCKQGQQFDPFSGFTCTEILNTTVCNNQAFTMKTGLCSWSGTCVRNATKTMSQLPSPPVFTCDAPNYVNNRTACERLADTYFLPCGFDNATNKCTALFLNTGNIKQFGDISNQNTCQSTGGTWKTESTFDPVANKYSSESWCEFGVEVKPFTAVGGGGSFSGGDADRLMDCSTNCAGCMFNTTGGRWPNSSLAQSTCTSSAAGCSFRTDSNAFNGFGWCNPSTEFGGFDCAKRCGDCNLLPSPQSSCNSSAAVCRWDNVTSQCIGAAAKGCDQECTMCSSNVTCISSQASGGCRFDTDISLCRPRGGAAEICFDGVDNDNNQQTDCADPKCAFDQFCAGSSGDQNNCQQYTSFRYGANAQANCTSAAGCAWTADNFGFSTCRPLSEQCFINATLSDSSQVCTSFRGGNVCQFKAANFCELNQSLMNNCFGQTQGTCGNIAGCAWSTNFNFCDSAAIVRCNQNGTLQTSENACNAAGCAWTANQTLLNFEGVYRESACAAPCRKSSITTQQGCANAYIASPNFTIGTCAWRTGFCSPKNFVGSCFENEGDNQQCSKNANCLWTEVVFGPMRHPNGSSSKADFMHPSSTWLAVGLDLQPAGGQNQSTYTVNLTNGSAMQLLTRNFNVSAEPRNISRLICGNTDIVRYNWSSGGRNCEVGGCNSYNTTQCMGATVHYYLNLTTKQLEVLWEMPLSGLLTDSTEGNSLATTLVNVTTVIIDGNISEHIAENATAQDGITKASRVRTALGFCQDKQHNTLFMGMEDNQPHVSATDNIGDATEPAAPYLDLSRIGVKKTPSGYIYGLTVRNIAGSIMCQNVPLGGGLAGTATNVSKYYLYLDTDGSSSNNCSPEDTSSLRGFEYQFKYVAGIDSSNFLSESLLSFTCNNGAWQTASISFKVDKNKACGRLFSGPLFALSKDALVGRSDVNTNIAWRTYATSANSTGNATSVLDSIGPGKTDFKGIDFKPLDCMRPEDKDDSQCTKFKQFGFFPGEFGPACADTVDNDGDGSTDCNDVDCKFDPFFCQGSFAPDPSDNTAPSVVWTKVNDKTPTSLAFIFDTNEPSQGFVNFYRENSTCSELNQTYNDKALLDASSANDYRNHHVIDIPDLTLNTTYYYKYSVCDISNNCAVAVCSNTTTAATHSNITFRIAIPTNWTLDIPSLNLTNYSALFGLKASTEFLNDINISIKAPDSVNAVTFVGIDIFEKQTLNLSGFVVGTDYIGVDSNQYQALKQKVGVDTVIVNLSTTGNQLQHCDDSGANCQDVTNNVVCNFGNVTQCTMSDAVGLGFSSYKAGSTSSGTTTTTSSSSSGGVGSRGGYAKSPLLTGSITAEKLWTSAAAGTEITMFVAQPAIAVKKIVAAVKKEIINLRLQVNGLATQPEKAAAFSGQPYQYLSITSTGDNSALGAATVSFAVHDAWTTGNNIDPSSVTLYRFANNAWTKLATSYKGKTTDGHQYEAMTPGFSYFVIGTEQPSTIKGEAEQAAEEKREEQKSGELAENIVEQNEAIPAKQASPASQGLSQWWVEGIVILFLLIAYLLLKRH